MSPHGDDLDSVFERIFAGESAVEKVGLGARRAGSEVLVSPVDFDPHPLISKASGRYMARASKMAVVAAHHAMEESGLLASEGGPAEAGI